MPGIEDLVALCAAGLLKAGVGAWKGRLWEEEKELLSAAAERPEVNVIGVHGLIYPSINAGGKVVTEGCDDLARAKYWDALRRLCERGAMEHVSGTENSAYLRLTSVGLEQARKLGGKDVT